MLLNQMESDLSPLCVNTSSVAKCLDTFWYKLTRTKPLDVTNWSETKLAKCLSIVDLTFLGVGCTLGAGIYVLTGQVAKSIAGPAVFLCFLIAGIASIFAGLCYAEFGARVPRAGSAYVYSYVTVGELCAFVIGWNLILEYVIGAASVARGTSAYIDVLCGKAMSTYLSEHAPISASSLSPYPDFLAFGLIMVLSVIVCLGMNESALINSIFTVINLFVIAYVVICGLFKLNGDNWSIPSNKVPDPDVNGLGGFLPFGVQGLVSGAATCFYAFVGFDVIATAGEETLHPQKAIPVAIISCLAICSVAYMLPAIVLTLMVPYFELEVEASLPRAFGHVGWYVAEYIISAGALMSLVTCLLTSVCGMPRVVYAMAEDGLLFRFLARVNKRFKTPAIATMVTAVLTGLMALFLELKDLIDMMSIGTLLAYSLVAICVQLLRYEYDSAQPAPNADEAQGLAMKTKSLLDTIIDILKPSSRVPTKRSVFVVKCCMFVYVIFSVWAGLVLRYLWTELFAVVWWAVFLLVFPLFIMVLSVVLTSLQPQQDANLTFKVPLVPLVPSLSVFINLYLMLNLSGITWLRFCIWMIVGFVIYFAYGIHHHGDGSQTRKPEHYVELDGSSVDTKSQTAFPSSLSVNHQQENSAQEPGSTQDQVPIPSSVLPTSPSSGHISSLNQSSSIEVEALNTTPDK